MTTSFSSRVLLKYLYKLHASRKDKDCFYKLFIQVKAKLIKQSILRRWGKTDKWVTHEAHFKYQKILTDKP